MVSTAHILFSILAGLALWCGPGWLVARAVMIRGVPAIALAPALGWAVQNMALLALAPVIGLSRSTILLVTALVCVSAPLLRRERETRPTAHTGARLLLPALAAAALLACIPAAAVLPKVGADSAIALATPIYDHAKIALIDEIALHGVVPPGNPVFGAGGAPGVISYYYLWHFGAAQLAILTGVTGWEADAAVTFLSAFAALALVAGIAFRLRPSAMAPLLALAAAASGSLRPLLASLFGAARIDQLVEPATGLAGMLYQASWSPHHVASASCVVLAVWLLAQMRDRPSPGAAVVLAFLVAAGFDSSLWVGGVTFALAGGAAVLMLAARRPSEGRGRFLALVAAVALGAGVLVAPILLAQLHVAAARGGGPPIRIEPFAVLGPAVPPGLRIILDIPAYWLVLLPIEFPAIAFAGSVGLIMALRGRHGRQPGTNRLASALGTLTLGALAISAFLVSTAGENNDLGWRAVLPAMLVLSGFAGAAIADVVQSRRWLAMGVAALLIAAGLPDSVVLATGNLRGMRSIDGGTFAGDPALWAAVRREVAAEVRIASNPGRLEQLTPWPINLSWALLARRRSCFAGSEMALAFAPLTPQQRSEAAELFARVFDGAGMPADLAQMRLSFGCGAAVVTAQDGAWRNDPFAASPLFRLAQEEEGRWRIYVAVASQPGTPP
ncbi:hypothetical protein [Xanthobacter oligotrophicus]|uniref:hypothetical protein n=1 Tax=Xanthobacter oligotrophicus TaxID=2607286 RepID=UPI0011F29E54|nr:hypothetical protein [Xanthobacter oligotrophicus]MCG5237848.1 hypothetical protein [Xanthobacter oligotrophicus]